MFKESRLSSYAIDFLPFFCAYFIFPVGELFMESNSAELCAFYVGAVVFLVRFIVDTVEGIEYDSIALGSGVFLLCGALITTIRYFFIHESSFIPSTDDYSFFYSLPASLRYSSSLFLYITLVGLILSFVSKRGFIQADGPSSSVYKGSLMLVGVSFAMWLLLALFYATKLHLSFPMSLIFGLLTPLQVLIVFRKFLKDQIKKDSLSTIIKKKSSF